MEWVETTGRTVEEAKEAALDELGVAEDDAEFEVLDEPRPGLFGRVRGEARVRARVRPTQPRPKEDRRDRRRRARSDKGSADAPDGEATDTSVSEEEEEEEPTVAAPPSGGDGRRRPGGRRGGAGEGKEAMEEDVPLEEQAEEAATFLQGLVETFELAGLVSSEKIDDDTVEVRVSGDELGLLIGPKGSTLAAVQELTRTVVQRKLRAHNGRLLVDVAGYRQKRKAALERFTQQVAREVKESGHRRILEPMSPPDRKVVHDTANTIEGVTTTSEGEEPRRRVVILPDA